jgi:two-component sensor histidine kinase
MLTRFRSSSDEEATLQRGKVVSFISRSVVRFVAALAVGLLSAYILSLFFAAQITESMLELRKAELKRLVSLGEASIQPVLESLRKGEIERDEALVEVRNTVRRLVYDDPATRNYLFMSSYGGRMLVMPFEPEKEGTYQWDLTDSNGLYIIRELVATAKRGSGYVEYYYPSPDREGPGRKISYVVGIDELSCYLGTGLYLSDVTIVLARFFRNSAIAVMLVFFALVFVLILFFKPYYSAYHFLLRQFSTIAENPEQIFKDLPHPFRAGSEVGLLMSNFSIMLGELNQARERVENSLNEKKILLKEIHHRVKNNLQIVSSLLNLQTASIEDPDQKQVFQESILRIHSMALVHETIYGGSSFREIDMADYLRMVTHSIYQSFGPRGLRVDLRFSLDQVSVTIDEAILCGLILTELVTNALKHGFAGRSQGRIEVAYTHAGTAAVLIVADDGCGVASDIFELSHGSLGITLVQSLSSQLGGTVSVESGQGSRFTVRFLRSPAA